MFLISHGLLSCRYATIFVRLYNLFGRQTLKRKVLIVNIKGVAMGEKKRWGHVKNESGGFDRVEYEENEPNETEEFDNHVKKLNKRIYGR